MANKQPDQKLNTLVKRIRKEYRRMDEISAGESLHGSFACADYQTALQYALDEVNSIYGTNYQIDPKPFEDANQSKETDDSAQEKEPKRKIVQDRKTYAALRKRLIAGLDILLEKEFAKLKSCIESKYYETRDDGSFGTLLEAAGLMKLNSRGYGMHYDEYLYNPTELGKQLYGKMVDDDG
jgi:hypothetical protein